MKTEKDFADFFVDSCQHAPELNEFVQQTAKNHWLDLTTHLNAYFSYEDRLVITKKAAVLLAKELQVLPPEEAWKSVIRSFVTENSWGFQTISKKPEIGKTEEQIIFKNLFRYISALVVGMILVKFAILFFGVRAAADPDQVSTGWSYAAFGLTLIFLIFLIYRNRNNNS